MSQYGYSPYGMPPYGYSPYGQYGPPMHQPMHQMHQMQQPINQPINQPMPPSQPGIPYIGAYISLVSKMDLRYEGTLYTIDPKNSTVALKDVRCFGTEDRATNQFVPPSPSIYEFIVFSGRDIKDLHVIERQKPIEQTIEQPLEQPVDQLEHSMAQTSLDEQHVDGIEQTSEQVEQAPIEHSNEAPEPATEPAAEPAMPESADIKPRGGRAYGRGGHRNQSHNNQSNNQANNQQANQSNPPAPRYTVSILPSTNAAPVQQQRRRHHAPRNQQNNTEILNSEFDFESSNARFNKDEFIQSAAAAANPAAGVTVDAPVYDLPVADDRNEAAAPAAAAAPVIGPKYDKKKSFFDDLGSSDRSNTRPPRTNQVDRETFGDSYVRGGRGRGHYHNRNRRGGGQNYNQQSNYNDQGNSGFPQRDNGGFPQRDNGGFPQRDNGGFPQRDNRRGGRGGYNNRNNNRNWSDLVNAGQDVQQQ